MTKQSKRQAMLIVSLAAAILTSASEAASSQQPAPFHLEETTCDV